MPSREERIGSPLHQGILFFARIIPFPASSLVAAIGAAVLTIFLCSNFALPKEHEDFAKQKESMRRLAIIAVGLEAYSRDNKNLFPIPASLRQTSHGEHANFWVNSKLQSDLIPKAWPIDRTRMISWLEPYLVPEYLKDLPLVDAWGHPIFCEVSSDGKHYTIISYGKDGKSDRSFRGYDWDAKEFNNDLIYTENNFISAPNGVSRG